MVSFLISVCVFFDLYASLLASLDPIGTFALRLLSFLCIFLSPENTSYMYGESGFLKLQFCLYLKSSQSETAIASVLYVALEPGCSIFYKISFASSDDSDKPAHMHCLIRIVTVDLKPLWVIGYAMSALRRLWSDCANAQADLSLRWAHMYSCRKCCAPAHFALRAGYCRDCVDRYCYKKLCTVD